MQQRILAMYTGSRKYVLLIAICILCGSWTPVNRQTVSPHKATSAYALEVAITAIAGAREPGTTGNFSVGLTLGSTHPEDITISYTVGGTATAGNDYTALSGTVVLPANTNAVQIPVDVLDDKLIEPTESVVVTLTGATTGSPAVPVPVNPANNAATVSITDDDNNINISSTAINAEEGGANGKFTFELPAGVTAANDITIDYTIQGSGVGVATEGVDYNDLSPHSIILPAGANKVDLVVTAIDDNDIEGDEDLSIQLNNVTDATGVMFTIGPNIGSGIDIIDNDNRLSITLATNGKEPGGAGNNAGFNISLPGGLTFTQDILVKYNIDNISTATGGPGAAYDYDNTTLTGEIVLPAGANSVLLPIIVNDDKVIEATETVSISLTPNASASTGSPAVNFSLDPVNKSAVANIADDDNTSIAIISTTDGKEPGGAGNNGSFRIGWTNGVKAPVGGLIVNFGITGSTATKGAGNDYTMPTSTFIPSGSSYADVTVTVLDDNLVEGPETVVMTLTAVIPGSPSSSPAILIGTPNPATVTIADNDVVSTQQWKSAAYTGTGAAGAVTAGDQITYTIHIRNTGNVSLSNVKITDKIPTYTEFVSADGGIVPDAAGTLTWTIPSIAIGGPDITRSFVVKVSNDLTGATNILNTAGVDNGDGSGEHPTTPPDPSDPNNPHPGPVTPGDPSTNVPVDQTKSSANWKSAAYTGTGAGGAVKPGDQITYTIHIRNTGHVKLTNVVITDNIPAYTQFVSAEGGITPDAGGKLTWNIAEVPVGSTDVTRSFVVRVVNDLTGATGILNTAGVDNGDGSGEHPTTPPDPGNPNNPNPGPNNPGDPSTNVPVDNGKQSVNWKSASYTGSGAAGAVTTGDEITYTIHIRNTGNVNLSNIKITDKIPTYTEFVSADGGAVPDATGTLTWTIPGIAVGAPDVIRSFVVRVVNDLTGATGILNTAGVDNGDGSGEHPTTPPDPSDPNNPHPGPVTPGDPSTNVPVDQSKRSLNWKSASYTGTGAAGAVKPGDQITYTIHIRNTGHVKLTNVAITDNIPAYTQFVSAEGGIVPDASGKLTWNIAEVPIGSTDVTRSFVVRVVNDLTGATGILNTAGVDNGDGSGEHPTTPPDPSNPNNPQTHPNPGDPSTNVPVDTAKHSVNWKSAAYTGTGVAGSVRSGDEITYTIHVRNTGYVKLTNVVITDNIPTYTQFVSAEGGIVPDAAGKLTWTVTEIPVGSADVTRSFTVKVANDLTNATYIVNTAWVDNGDGGGNHPTGPQNGNDPNQPKPNPDPNDPATEVPVDNGKNSANWKSASYTGSGAAGAVTTGDEITYTIHVRNIGSVTLTNVQITDNVPAYTEFVSAEGGIGPDVTGKLSWTVATIAVGAPDVTRSFTVKVVKDLTGATSIINTAAVDNGNGKGGQPSTPPDPSDPNNPHPHPNPGDPATNIPVGKVSTFDTWKSVATASGNPKAKAGEILTYTIQVRNTGNVTIPAINITDTVPAHTTFESATDGGTYDRATNAVKWTLSNLALGAIADVTFKVKVSTGLDSTVPVITNTAYVSDGTVTVPTSGCDPASAGCNGHPGTEIETIPDESDGGLFIVNAMSPNGDGKNEYFIIKGLEKYGKAVLYVFNRWGSMVYQSKEYHNDWNGTGLSEGTYFYKLELKETAGGVKLYKGWVVIKRN
ncbi:DUF7507 domain-containing protein [Chitinophaga rupis]|nr:Calx-beta domain-containing protein [Chitinophaga rupis]